MNLDVVVVVDVVDVVTTWVVLDWIGLDCIDCRVPFISFSVILI